MTRESTHTKTRFILVLGCAFGVTSLTALTIARSRPSLWIRVLHAGKIRQGQAIIGRIETFRAASGRLPDSLAELGLPDQGPVYYDRLDAGRYAVWFSHTLGESYSFDSRDREWDVRVVLRDAPSPP